MKKQTRDMILILMGIIIVALVGYFIFIKYMTVFVPNISSYSLILIAIVAGIAAFFNPCNFAVLPSYLSYNYSLSEETSKTSKNKFKSILVYGLVAALGIIVFNLILGSLIGLLGAGFGKSFALAGDTPNLIVRIFRGVIGSILIVFGFLHLSGRGVQFKFISKISQSLSSSKQTNPYIGLFSFGFFYNAIGIGCSGPILAGLTVFAFASGGFYTALFAFLLFSLTMAVLMILISLLTGLSKGNLISKIGTSTLAIKKISGTIMILVGLLLLFSSIFVKEFVRVLFPS
ncbi:MAG: hypothetical protein IH845_01845 [Nanoarchaeota archaeon]|nr:hypothetical protein [Nanoarchaeota archaeon]